MSTEPLSKIILLLKEHWRLVSALTESVLQYVIRLVTMIREILFSEIRRKYCHSTEQEAKDHWKLGGQI